MSRHPRPPNGTGNLLQLVKAYVTTCCKRIETRYAYLDASLRGIRRLPSKDAWHDVLHLSIACLLPILRRALQMCPATWKNMLKYYVCVCVGWWAPGHAEPHTNSFAAPKVPTWIMQGSARRVADVSKQHISNTLATHEQHISAPKVPTWILQGSARRKSAVSKETYHATNVLSKRPITHQMYLRK